MLALAITGWAPPPLTFTPHLEVRSRLLLSGESLGDGEVAQQALIGLGASRRAVEAEVSFQAVRGWHQRAGAVEVEGSFQPELAAGWVAIGGDLSENIEGRVVVGRQRLQLHDGRLLGDDDWDMGGRWLDAVQLDLQLAPLHASYVNARRFGLRGADPLGFGVNLLCVGAGAEGPEVSWLLDGVSLVDARHTDATSATTGAYGRLSWRRLRLRGEGYLQVRGELPGGLFSGEVGRVFGENERLVLSLALDVASGQGADRAVWVPVLGDTREFWGLVDLYKSPASYSDGGLTDLRLSARSRLLPQLSLEGAVHRFGRVDATGSGTGRGVELDTRLSWEILPMATLSTGGGLFLFSSDPSTNQSQFWVELHASF